MMESYVNRTPFLECTASFNNAVAALSFLEQNDIDLIFCDIQMPDLNGLQLAHLLQQSNISKHYLVFTTAYDQFAIDGYRVNATDYLLKPINYEDFLRAALKVKEERDKQKSIITKEDEEYLYLKLDYKYLRIPFNDILLIESVKDYVKIFVLDKKIPTMILSSLKAIETKLPADKFIRIHRSYIIGIRHIEYLTKSSVYINNMEILVGDIYKDAFKKMLDQWNNNGN